MSPYWEARRGEGKGGVEKKEGVQEREKMCRERDQRREKRRQLEIQGVTGRKKGVQMVGRQDLETPIQPGSQICKKKLTMSAKFTSAL